jgi:predicted nucleic acid-binding protein
MAGSEVFVDSGLWIAAAREPDAQHERAKFLGRQILERRSRPVISDMVLAEVVTFILKKDGPEPAEKLMDLLEAHTTVLFVSRAVLDDAKTILRRYWSPRKRLSICDATSYVLMQDRKISDLYSFDSGFDGLPGVTRIA